MTPHMGLSWNLRPLPGKELFPLSQLKRLCTRDFAYHYHIYLQSPMKIILRNGEKNYELFFFPKQPTIVTPPLLTFLLESGPLQGFPGGLVVKNSPEMQET